MLLHRNLMPHLCAALQKEEVISALQQAVNATAEAAAHVNATVERLKQVSSTRGVGEIAGRWFAAYWGSLHGYSSLVVAHGWRDTCLHWP